MTKQETVNFVFAHLRRQQVPSRILPFNSEEVAFCQYFDPASGRSCSVGCLAPDFFKANPEVEGCSVRGALSSSRPGEKHRLLIDSLPGFDLELLADLQGIHDSCLTTFSEPFLEEAFERSHLAETHQVTFPQP
jgi:hypothetical protein